MVDGKVKWEIDSHSDEETVPLAQDSSFKDHGSVKRKKGSGNGFLVNGTKKNYVELDSDDDGKVDEPMSIVRKFVFVMSFSAWVLYFAVLLWLLPCKTDKCLSWKKWTFILENAQLTSNLESNLASERDDLVVLGYSEHALQANAEGKVAALNSEDGNLSWTESLNFLPEILLKMDMNDSNEVSGEKILALGRTGIAFLNGSNGDLFWQREDSSENIVLSISPVLHNCDGNYWRLLYAREKTGKLQLGVLDMISGQTIVHFQLPCGNERKIEVEVVSIHDRNQSLVVCHLRSVTNVWAIPKDILCRNPGNPDEILDAQYDHVTSFDGEVPQNDGPIRTTVADDTALMTWWNVISAVSVKNTSFLEQWRKTFPHFKIKAFLIGRFTSSGQDEIAVAMEDFNSKLMVSTLELRTGKELSATTAVVAPSAISLESMTLVPRRLTGKKTDAIIIGTKISTRDGSSGFSSNVTYTLLRFDRKPALIKELLTVESRGDRPPSISLTGHNPGLVVAEPSGNSSWTISRRLRLVDEETWCFL